MDVKELAGELTAATALLREHGEKADAEAKRLGDVTAETKQAMERLNERIDQLETELQGKGRRESDPEAEAKAAAMLRKGSFFDYMRGGFAELAADQKAALRAIPDEMKALVENATGQILVPEDLDNEVIRKIGKLSIMRPLVGVRPTNRDRVRVRSLTEVAVGWGKLETGTAITESTLTPSEDFHYVEDLYGLTKIGEDELDDTDVNLEPIVTDSFGRAVSEEIDNKILLGDGHASQEPEGILKSTDADLVANDLTSGAVGVVDDEDIVSLEYQVKAQYRGRGVYVFSDALVKAVRLTKDANGQYLWQPAVTAGEPATFGGKAVHVSSDMPATATGAYVALFGDFKAGYRLLERRGMTIQRLNELYAETGLVGFKARRRVGGGVIRGEAMARLKVG